MPLTITTAIILGTVSCAQQPGAGDRRQLASAKAPAVVPFAAFLAGVRSASYRSYAGRPGTRVRDEQAFEEMRGFVLARYSDARVARSYMAAGAVFDCTEGSGASPLPPAPAGSPTTPAQTTPAQTEPCPDGSVPVRRITLLELVRFPTLRQYLGKSLGGAGAPPPAGPSR
jgi:hypothetical protein